MEKENVTSDFKTPPYKTPLSTPFENRREEKKKKEIKVLSHNLPILPPFFFFLSNLSKPHAVHTLKGIHGHIIEQVDTTDVDTLRRLRDGLVAVLEERGAGRQVPEVGFGAAGPVGGGGAVVEGGLGNVVAVAGIIAIRSVEVGGAGAGFKGWCGVHAGVGINY